MIYSGNVEVFIAFDLKIINLIHPDHEIYL